MAVRRLGLPLLLFLLCGIAPATPEPPRPNIILITLDTTRADRMGFLGSTRGLTPNLDAAVLACHYRFTLTNGLPPREDRIDVEVVMSLPLTVST